MRYIGGKSELLESLDVFISKKVGSSGTTFCDLFSGTAVVGQYFKKQYSIISNDMMYFSYILQRAKIELQHTPTFTTLKEKLGISDVVLHLESHPYVVQDNYFITKTYSPWKGNDIMCFTVENAGRIDFIRQTIELWKEKDLINEQEYIYLLAGLIQGVPSVSNTTGIYEAYLKNWKDKRAHKPFAFEFPEIVDNTKSNQCFNEDANTLLKTIQGDILYIDPPYNSRKYGSNYHVLETIARYDYPETKGKTAMRSNYQRSDYNYKSKVKKAFDNLIKEAQFQHIFLSYSDDGLLKDTDLKAIFTKYGIEETYEQHKIDYRRYKSKQKQKKQKVTEYIFYIQKDLNNTSVSKSTKGPKKGKKKSSKKNSGVSNNVPKDTQLKLILHPTDQPKTYVKSPLNYTGGKFKLLPQLYPLFPKDIDHFFDIFAGGLNVGINIDAQHIYANDLNVFVTQLLTKMYHTSKEDVLAHIEGRIKKYGLSKTNEEGYKSFRKDYNAHPIEKRDPLDLYAMLCYSYNYQIRFNNNHEYNNPFGKNKSRFSPQLKNRLLLFLDTLHKKKLTFTSLDFTQIDFSLCTSKSFVYADPPYLISTGSYNDGKRGFSGWNKEHEKKLLALLDALHLRGIRFALSNVLRHKDKENKILIEWAKKYNVHNLNKSYANSSHNTKRKESQEVLITNYDASGNICTSLGPKAHVWISSKAYPNIQSLIDTLKGKYKLQIDQPNIDLVPVQGGIEFRYQLTGIKIKNKELHNIYISIDSNLSSSVNYSIFEGTNPLDENDDFGNIYTSMVPKDHIWIVSEMYPNTQILINILKSKYELQIDQPNVDLVPVQGGIEFRYQLTGVEIKNKELHNIYISMNSNLSSSVNHLIFEGSNHPSEDSVPLYAIEERNIIEGDIKYHTLYNVLSKFADIQYSYPTVEKNIYSPSTKQLKNKELLESAEIFDLKLLKTCGITILEQDTAGIESFQSVDELIAERKVYVFSQTLK